MKQFLSLFLLFILHFSFGQDTIIVDGQPQYIYSQMDSVLETAYTFKGVRYQYAGMSSQGIDCSGLVCRAYQEVNIKLPRTSSALAAYGESIEADFLEKGDLIFFKGRKSNSVGHVAMVSRVKNGLIHIIHATSSRGVIEEVLQYNNYFMQRWLFNRRVN